jgi:hypothetical protein
MPVLRADTKNATSAIAPTHPGIASSNGYYNQRCNALLIENNILFQTEDGNDWRSKFVKAA